MLLFRWGYPPLSTRQKTENGVSVLYLEVKNGKWGFVKMKFGLNGVGSNSNGLILWENDATKLGIIFKQDFWPPEA